MKHRAVVFGLFLASAAHAGDRTVDGQGRISLIGGYKWAPNTAFMKAAEVNGHPVEGGTPGGPQVAASFGYGALAWLEVAIDLAVGFESFRLAGYEDSVQSTTYGALIGVRLGKVDWPWRNLSPHFGAQFGPMLSFITSRSLPNSEKLNTGYSVDLGATWRLGEKWGVGLSARYLFATGTVPEIGTVQAGGLWVGLSISYYLPPGPKDPMGGML